jgi:hypothetical protein
VQIQKGEVFERASKLQTSCVSNNQATTPFGEQAASRRATFRGPRRLSSICKGASVEMLGALAALASMASVGGMQAPSFARVSNQHSRTSFGTQTLVTPKFPILDFDFIPHSTNK